MRTMIAGAALLIAVAAPSSADADPATDAFERLKSLEGSWVNADKPDSPLRIRFTVTARGSTVVEEWRAGDAPHSLTIYARDGNRLVATHYCPQGNQPRLATADLASLEFGFLDVTDLDPGESHAHDLTLAMADGQLLRRERYAKDGAPGEWMELRLTREN